MRDGISLSNSTKIKPIIIPSEFASLKTREAFVQLSRGKVSRVLAKEFSND